MEPMDTMAQQDESLQREIIALAKRSRFKRRFLTTAAILLVVLLAMLGAWMSGKSQAKEKTRDEIAELKAEIEAQKETINQLKEAPMVVSPVSPSINLEVIRSEINNIGELATTEYLFTDAAEFSDSKQIKSWNIPLTKKSFILKWSGVIKAGIELDKVTIEVDESEKKVHVSVPTAKILSYFVDGDSVEVLNEKDNIFNNISINDKVKFDSKTEEAIKNRAIENGLLEKAQKNAEDILSRLILSDPVAHEEYTVEFTVLP